jgi:hypothetical protein
MANMHSSSRYGTSSLKFLIILLMLLAPQIVFGASQNPFGPMDDEDDGGTQVPSGGGPGGGSGGASGGDSGGGSQVPSGGGSGGGSGGSSSAVNPDAIQQTSYSCPADNGKRYTTYDARFHPFS